jgi:hypothetical protein
MPLTDQMASLARRASRRQPEQAIVHNRATKADILRMLRKDICLHVSMAEASLRRGRRGSLAQAISDRSPHPPMLISNIPFEAPLRQPAT